MNPVNLGPTGREKPVPMGDFMVEGIELILRLPEERFLGPGMADRHREVALACVERYGYQAIPAVGLPNRVLCNDVGATFPEQLEGSLMGERIT